MFYLHDNENFFADILFYFCPFTSRIKSPETDYVAGKNAGVHVSLPYYEPCWCWKIINSRIKFAWTRFELFRTRPYFFHFSQYYATQQYMLVPVFIHGWWQ